MTIQLKLITAMVKKRKVFHGDNDYFLRTSQFNLVLTLLTLRRVFMFKFN